MKIWFQNFLRTVLKELILWLNQVSLQLEELLWIYSHIHIVTLSEYRSLVTK